MFIKNKVSSKVYNTFNIDTSFKTLIGVETVEELPDILASISSKDYKILGGGSNILITTPISEPVLQINIKGIEIVKDSEEYVLVKFAAGENWHDCVLWAVENGFGGIENLSLIPGNCGAGPMQNIGAYGVEIKDVLHSVNAFSIADKVELTFHNQECGLGYRTSFFKTKWKSKFIITSIILKLTKDGFHKIETSYGAIQNKLVEHNWSENTSLKNISDVVIEIRSSKLPNPSKIGNAGSFFKNPIIDIHQFEKLKTTFSNIVSYPVDEEHVKIPAGWLIDQCGWKGKRIGDTGTYKNQALVLVNHGSATGSEIYKLSEEIATSVLQKFNIELEREVNIW